MTISADRMLERARSTITRVPPAGLAKFLEQGGLVVDIRPEAQRRSEGEFPGALVIERNVLEWRFDPSGENCLPEARDVSRPVLLLCSEGYASSLAAASLVELGYESAADLEGGYKAWASQRDGLKA
jgi:rhodanese-related sulfurtransferase